MPRTHHDPHHKQRSQGSHPTTAAQALSLTPWPCPHVLCDIGLHRLGISWHRMVLCFAHVLFTGGWVIAFGVADPNNSSPPAVSGPKPTNDQLDKCSLTNPAPLTH